MENKRLTLLLTAYLLMTLIFLGLNALGNVATNVNFDHKVTGTVLICIYNYIKNIGTDYVVQHSSEYELLHDFVLKTKKTF